jgi:hypothetical protein
MEEAEETRKVHAFMSMPVKEVQKRYQLELIRYQKQIARVKKTLLTRKKKAA